MNKVARKVFSSLNSQVITNSAARTIVNGTLNNTMEVAGQGISNVVEDKLNEK